MKKVFKMIGTIALGLVGIAVVGGGLFLGFSPEFGGKHTAEDVSRYEASGYYKDGAFQNLVPTNMDMGGKDMMKVMYEFMFGGSKRKPEQEPPMEKLKASQLQANNNELSFVWYGHSTFFMQMDQKNILIDPMFSDVPAPHPTLGNKRYQSELPLSIDSLPTIDLVLISHDHYDHLDYESIKKIKDKVTLFYVPLGVAAHLKEWGVDPQKIKEFNWWEEAQLDSLALAFTPARHFSGRGLNNRFSTMWGSWVIKSPQKNVFFSGDSGYGDHFKEIGQKYGPFDLAFMECGQYNEMWSNIHMMPEETAIASKDVQAKLMMPIHWGAFTLALHEWTDPIKRVIKKSEELAIPLIAPKVGKLVHVTDSVPTNQDWWTN
jgi:L-ascorbate metabolism protein UlaG (beta-lactamase superfamily)